MIWNLLLKIKESIINHNGAIHTLCIDPGSESFPVNFNVDEGPVRISFSDQPPTNATIKLDIFCPGPFRTEITANELISSEEEEMIRIYLPYAILPLFSRQLNKCFAITHFAQTLDGRIASISGHSKWIGNDENLVHAHKMRALCDGILIGARTLETDNPRLDVRHVDGQDPVKIIIGGDQLPLDEYQAIDDRTIFFSQNHIEQRFGLTTHSLPKSDGKYDIRQIMDILFRDGLSSIYIEGGSVTTSHFLEQGRIDQMQIHLTPKILGSGITGFNFGEAETVNESITFTDHRYHQMGDHIMFVGELNGPDDR